MGEKITTEWSKADHRLYLDILLEILDKIEKETATSSWRWARHIVNINKYNKENTDEAK